ncbi:MAG: ComEC/Rec2 family competence protein [Parvularculaceae bacterium]
MVADLVKNDVYAASARTPSPARLAYIVSEKIKRWAAADRPQIALWTPVAIGLGAGIYFGLKAEPPWEAGAAALLLFTALAIAAPFRFRMAARALMFAALGFVAAEARTAIAAAPQIARETRIVEVTGRIVSVEESARQRRYVIALDSVEGLPAEETPARARLTWRGKEFAAIAGDHVSVRARLSPPPPPVAPGAFDFARQLYFQRIGAVGFAVSAPDVDVSAPKSWRQRVAVSVERMRFGLFKRITEAAPGAGGAIIAAIVTGKRDAITEQSEAALRDAGLAHLLAISGLHMGLATGLVFFAVRFALAAIPAFALRYPVKKWAAAAALASGLFYLVLSGGGWSAQRAFIMSAIIFAAILVDRRALSLRNVAISACIILLIAPEALFSPGFQMSFAAVTALIAAYEWMGEAIGDEDWSWSAKFRRLLFPRTKKPGEMSLSAKFQGYIVALAATDVIAALATAPYALYHFNRAAIYSLPANMAAMPLMGFLIVPFAVIALVLSPFGLDGWAWRAAAFFMEQVLNVAAYVSGLPGAVSLTVQWPLAAMLALTLGGLWLCLSRAPWRLAGLLSIPVAALLVSAVRLPALYVSPSGLNAAVLHGEESERSLLVYSTRKERFAASIWIENAGLDPERVKPVAMKTVFACDASGCAGEEEGARISIIEDKAALAEDCARADIVVALFPVSGRDWRQCEATLIDRRAIWNKGAHAVWIENDGDIRVQAAKDIRGVRPWTGGG